MPQQRRDRRQIHLLNQATGRVMAESMRMDVGYVGTPAENSQEIADAAVRVRSSLPAEHSPLNDERSNGAKRVAHGRIQRNDTCFLTFALSDRCSP
jgi:hypothetical protein